MTRTSLLPSSLVASTAMLLGFGCTAPADGGSSDDGEDPIEEAPPSSYMENGYPTILEENEDYLGEGSARRDLIHSFGEMVDQNGNNVDFRQFLGYTVILDVSAEWCGPCQAAAATAQAESEELQEMGAVYYIQILGQDSEGLPATEETAARWADTYGLELPVLADGGNAFDTTIELASWPTFFVLRPDGEIDHRQGGAVSAERMVAWVEYLLRNEDGNFRDIPGWPDVDAEHE